MLLLIEYVQIGFPPNLIFLLKNDGLSWKGLIFCYFYLYLDIFVASAPLSYVRDEYETFLGSLLGKDVVRLRNRLRKI